MMLEEQGLIEEEGREAFYSSLEDEYERFWRMFRCWCVVRIVGSAELKTLCNCSSNLWER